MTDQSSAQSAAQYRWLVTVKDAEIPIVVNELAATAYRDAGHKVEEVVPRSEAEALAGALEMVLARATHGYQDLRPGGVLASLKGPVAVALASYRAGDQECGR